VLGVASRLESWLLLLSRLGLRGFLHVWGLGAVCQVSSLLMLGGCGSARVGFLVLCAKVLGGWWVCRLRGAL